MSIKLKKIVKMLDKYNNQKNASFTDKLERTCLYILHWRQNLRSW